MLRSLLIVVAACGSSAPSEPVQTAPIAPIAKAEPKLDAKVAKLYGTTPPAWQVDRWINSAPRSLESLRGKVVLVRWWTAGCPFCSASAPALRTFHKDYGPKGLVVIGMYHHKDDGPFDPAVYEATANKYGFTFPLAFDPEWKTLHSWMGAVETGFTSVTFLLDKRGVIRHVHPGGEYVAGDAGHTALDRAITELLAEPSPVPATYTGPADRGPCSDAHGCKLRSNCGCSCEGVALSAPSMVDCDKSCNNPDVCKGYSLICDGSTQTCGAIPKAP